jgi:hypothetical protein
MMRFREFYVVATDVETGFEEWFRTLKQAGAACGASDDGIERAIRFGRTILYWRFRKAHVRYLIVSRTGQEVVCRYDPERKVLVSVDGGIEFGKRQYRSCEELIVEKDGSLQRRQAGTA